MASIHKQTKELQEKHRKLLLAQLKKEGNEQCMDCNSTQPTWASTNIGIYLCIRCSGLHRQIGVHITKVKSLTLDTWEPQQVKFICGMGNLKAKETFEALLPPGTGKPAYNENDLVVEQWIRAKYEHRKYYSERPAVKKVPKVTSAALEDSESVQPDSPEQTPPSSPKKLGKTSAFLSAAAAAEQTAEEDVRSPKAGSFQALAKSGGMPSTSSLPTRKVTSPQHPPAVGSGKRRGLSFMTNMASCTAVSPTVSTQDSAEEEDDEDEEEEDEEDEEATSTAAVTVRKQRGISFMNQMNRNLTAPASTQQSLLLTEDLPQPVVGDIGDMFDGLDVMAPPALSSISTTIEAAPVVTSPPSRSPYDTKVSQQSILDLFPPDEPVRTAPQQSGASSILDMFTPIQPQVASPMVPSTPACYPGMPAFTIQPGMAAAQMQAAMQYQQMASAMQQMQQAMAAMGMTGGMPIPMQTQPVAYAPQPQAPRPVDNSAFEGLSAEAFKSMSCPLSKP